MGTRKRASYLPSHSRRQGRQRPARGLGGHASGPAALTPSWRWPALRDLRSRAPDSPWCPLSGLSVASDSPIGQTPGVVWWCKVCLEKKFLRYPYPYTYPSPHLPKYAGVLANRAIGVQWAASGGKPGIVRGKSARNAFFDRNGSQQESCQRRCVHQCGALESVLGLATSIPHLSVGAFQPLDKGAKVCRCIV